MRHDALIEAQDRLISLGILPAVVAPLQATQAQCAEDLKAALRRDVRSFSASGNPDVLPDLARHMDEHLAEILHLCSPGVPDTLHFVTAHARRRAEQHFPLEAILHSYRSSHRQIAQWMRGAALALDLPDGDSVVSACADFAIEYTNAISALMTAEYVSHTRLLAEAEGDRRKDLLDLLLAGYDESDGRIADLLRRAGYLEQNQAYCVVAAQSTQAVEMASPARAQRLAAALVDAVSDLSIRCLTGMRNDTVVAIYSMHRRQSGWTAPGIGLDSRIKPPLFLLGPSVLVGMSRVHPATAFLPQALAEAELALDCATVANRVVDCATLPLRSLLLHRAPQYLQAARPPWRDALTAADHKADGMLVATLRAIADADLNVQAAARQLGRHPNTLHARLEKISALTGLDCQSHHDLTEMLLAIDCWPG